MARLISILVGRRRQPRFGRRNIRACRTFTRTNQPRHWSFSRHRVGWLCLQPRLGVRLMPRWSSLRHLWPALVFHRGEFSRHCRDHHRCNSHQCSDANCWHGHSLAWLNHAAVVPVCDGRARANREAVSCYVNPVRVDNATGEYSILNVRNSLVFC